VASPITVNATVQDITSTDLNNPANSSAFVRFRLRNFQGSVPQISGTSIVAETLIDSLPGASGAISQLLWGNNNITPANTYYTVELWSKGRITSSGNYIFNANTNLDTASPINPTPAPQGPSSIVFENNGALNSSQTLLNLANTDGSITLTDLGGGEIDITSNAGANFKTPGQNFFFGPGIPFVYGLAWQAGQIGAANQAVYVFGFNLEAAWTLTSASYISQNSGAGEYYGFGIYDANGNAKIRTSFLSTAIGSATTNTFPPVTLPPGFYYFAQSVDATGLSAPSITLPGNGGSISNTTFFTFLNANGTYVGGIAANPMGANTGVMPATLGAISPITTQTIAAAAVKWAP